MHVLRFLKKWIFLILTPLFFLAASVPAAADTHVSGSITTDTTWTPGGSPYIVTGNMTVYNAALTIEPGVVVKLNPGRSITFGYSSYLGKLVAQGTPDAPIIFTSNQTDPWSHLSFTNQTDPGSVIKYCTIENGGSSNGPMVRVASSNVAIEHVSFRNTQDEALEISGGAVPILGYNTYTGIGGYPITISHPHSVSAVDSTSIFDASNADNRVYYVGYSITQNVSMANPGIPYYWFHNATIYNGLSQTEPATLTISPGVEIQIRSGRTIQFGYSKYKGKLVAQGTAAQPIIFTAADTAAPWQRFEFTGQTGADSIMSHCIVEYGGASGYPMLDIFSSNISVRNCTIQHSAAGGLRIGNEAVPALDSNHYTENGTYPIIINHAHSVSAVDSTSTFDGSNGDNRVYYVGHSITRNASMADPGIPYDWYGNSTIYNAVLTILPGAEIQFRPGRGIQLGYSSHEGRLVAQGTATDPITFTRSGESPWARIELTDQTGAGSVMAYCTFEYGGTSGYAMVDVYSSNVSIQNCTFRHAAGNALQINNGVIPVLGYNHYSQNTGHPIRINNAHSISAVDTTSTFDVSNGDNRIFYVGHNITQNTAIADPGIPYRWVNSSTVYGAELTISPGVELQFDGGRGLTIGYNINYSPNLLTAEGTAENPIIFTSGNASPTAGSWVGIRFENEDTGSTLENAIVEYGGSGGYGNISINSSSPVINTSVIRYSSNYGVRISGQGQNSAGLFCNTITGNDTGIHVSGNAGPIIHDNNITGNTTFGLNSTNSGIQVNAEDNFWGGPGGPGTPAADHVAGDVDYTPWLGEISPCTVPLSAGFSADKVTGCEELTVSFIDGSTGAVASRTWDFGDGSATSSDENPVHTFTEPGIFIVSLTVRDEGGGADMHTQEISVNESVPTADFSGTPQSGTPPLSVSFTDASIVCGTESITLWEWDFNNDGVIDSADQNPIHSFYTAGDHTISLTVTDEDGNTDTMTRTDYIYVSDEAPVAVPGGPYSGTEGAAVNFIGSGSYDPNGGNITQYQWDFNNDGIVDRTTSAGSIWHIFDQEGSYTVSLTVTDGAGLQGSNTTTAVISDTDPDADFTADLFSGLAPFTVNFQDLTQSHDGITNYLWDFGDGSGTSFDQNPEYTYTSSGTFTVRLTVWEADGDQDTEVKAAYIEVAPCTIYYYDGDQDGYGLASDSQCMQNPAPPYTATQAGDCNDGVAAINPGAEEICGDNIDNNCNGVENEGCIRDCNGDWNGTAYIDNCGLCVGGNTGKTACAQDCNGDWGGTAYIDECGDCVGGNTGKTPCTPGCQVNEIPGDLDGDCDVDSGDRSLIISSLRKCSGTPGFNADADYDGDNCITFSDYRQWMSQYRAYLSGPK